jgi:ADP-ribose pyrophosphatase
MNSERWIHSRRVYDGDIFRVRAGVVRVSGHGLSERAVVEHRGGAATLPVFDDGSVLLVQQFRISMRKEMLELPGGRLNVDETPLRCALRELREEVGFVAKRMKLIAKVCVAPGFTNAKNYIFLGSGLQKVKQMSQTDELVRAIIVCRTKAAEMLEKRQIFDANTIIALSYYINHEC